MGTDVTTPSRGPAFVLAAVIVGAFLLYTGLVSRVEVPRVHPDELRYALAGSSVADGEGVLNRGVSSGFGPIHAGLLAAVLLVAGDRDSAYPFWKVTNVLLFVLSAFPIFLLARRLLPPWWSVGAAALSLTIPSAIYVSVVMTESAAFFLTNWAVLAIVLAVERPTIGRQLAALVVIGLATATRAQFGVLLAAFIGALVLEWGLARDRPLHSAARALWPTLAATLLGVVAFVARPLTTGSSLGESLGPYHDLWTGYEPLAVIKWTLYHAADLELYLAVLPFAVAPVVIWRLLVTGRESSAVRERAFATSFLTVSVSFLLVAGAFSSLPYGYDRLHDRYLFYVVPLWIVVFVLWLKWGLPRRFVALATGVVIALVLPAILPFRQLANEAGVDTVPGALWVWLESQTAGPGPLSGRALLAAFVLGLLALGVVLPRRLWPALPAAIVVVFVATSVLAWNRMIGAPEDEVFAGSLNRTWIDDAVPSDARVWKVYIESERCPTTTVGRHALFLTEFFNDTVRRAAFIGDSLPDGIPIDRVDVENGALFLEDGDRFSAEYVFTQPGIELRGEKVVTGTNANLVLWLIDGPVSITNAQTNDEVRTADCA